MQGQRGTISSLPESLNFEYGSTSGGATSEQQLLWSNFQNSGQDQIPGYVLPVNDTNMRCVNSFSQEQRSLGRCGFSEPISSSTENEICDDRQVTTHGQSSATTACVSAATMLERREPDHNSLFVRTTDSDATCQNLNLNVDLVNHGDDHFQVTEQCNQYKSRGTENQLIPPGHDSHGFLLSSGGDCGHSMEANDGQPSCSFGGRRASSKRKALEGHVGQSSIDASSSYFNHAESSAWPGIPPQYNEERNLSMSSSSEQVNPRLWLGARVPESIPDAAAVTSLESSQRNFRLRTNPSGQQESLAPNLLLRGSTSRHYVTSLSHQPQTSLEIDHSLNLMAAPAITHVNAQNPNVAICVPSLPQNVQSFSWTRASGSRSVASTSVNVSGGRDAVPVQERRLRSISRNMVNHPVFVSESNFRNSGQILTNRSSSDASNVPGNLASTSHTGSSSIANQSSPSLASNSNPDSQYPRRFSELVRRSLWSSLGAESGSQSSNHPPLPPGTSTSPGEILFPSGVGSRGHHRSYLRPGSWLQQQGDGVLEIPHPLQNLAPGREGRSRLVVSEIRNVLDLMRRGEGLRFEDVMILDQSVFFGVADIHDRHRDMRLDVDNMSYEELLALEERIGNVCTGLDEETIFNHLKQRKWTVAPGGQAEAEPCCICQEEYNIGEDVGKLECGHDFHSECIKQWLMHKNLCPICKTTGLTK